MNEIKPLGNYILIKPELIKETNEHGVALPADQISKIRTGEIVALPEQDAKNSFMFSENDDYKEMYGAIKVGDTVLVAKHAGIEKDGLIFVQYDNLICTL